MKRSAPMFCSNWLLGENMPDPSIESTRSGLRPSSAARIKRWAWAAVALPALLLGLVLVMVLAYLAVSFALVFFPANADAPQNTQGEIQAYVQSNGVHTDLVFPIRSALVDWTSVFPWQQFPAVPADARWVSIGWGDREFYLNTPQWRDLTVGRALGALSGRHGSLLHVAYWRDNQLASQRRALPLSASQYAALVQHVRRSLAGDSLVAQAVPNAHYDEQDAFFEARGHYGPFETCNTWVGRGLREAGVKTSRWTPFDAQVLWHLEPVSAAP